MFGHLADKFGRKPVMLVCLFLPVFVGLGTSFATSYWMFVSLRFIQGILMQVPIVFDLQSTLLSRSPRDSLKYFEISDPIHIRFAELRKRYMEQPHFTMNM